jgi:hypothetical protein
VTRRTGTPRRYQRREEGQGATLRAVTALTGTPSASAVRNSWGAALPMSAIAVAAFFGLVALPRATMPLADGDVWWHLRAGEAVLSTGSVPTIDTWTLVGNGMRWITQDWLSNTAMAAILRLGAGLGETLLSLVFGALVVAAFALLWRAVGVRRGDCGWFGKLTFLTASLVVAGPVVGVRVQTVDLVMTALTVWVLWHYLVDRRGWWLVLLPLLTAAWVNLHAGFPILFLLGGAMLAGEGLDRWLGRRVSPAPLTWRELGWLAAALALAGAAVMLNPNGPAMYAYPFATAGIQAHRDFIFEWSRPDLSSLPGQLLFAFLILVVMPTLLLSRREMRAADAFWLVGVTLLSLQAIRFVLAVGPIGGALAAIYLAPHVRASRLGEAVGPITDKLSRPPRTPSQGTMNAALCAVVVVVGMGVAVARVTPDAQRAEIDRSMPVGATQWLSANAPDARIFNVYAWGGWLGRELPGARVYIDGRSDIYGDAPIRQYAEAIAVHTDPAVLLDRYRVSDVVFWPDSALAGWLDASPGWRRVYTDSQAVIWERRG